MKKYPDRIKPPATIPAPPGRRFFLQGYCAYQMGKDSAQCPYEKWTGEYRYWMAGWFVLHEIHAGRRDPHDWQLSKETWEELTRE
jgi:hypothetical protein